MWDRYNGFLYGFVSIITIWVLFKLLTKSLEAYTRRRAYKEENAKAFIRYWQYGYLFAAVILVVTAFSGEIQALGITMGFIGSLLAWMLSAPIRNMAGWLFLIISRPLKVGDRVIIGGYIGDVVDITMNYIVMNQVGGTTVGEERSGRGILVPTSMLFGQIINNYSMKFPDEGNKYLLDEVTMRISYDSDWETAENILISVAKEVTADAIRDCGEEPYIRAEFFPSGVFMKVRYRVLPTDRQRVWSEIVKRASQLVKSAGNIHYGFNKSEVFVKPEGEEEVPPPQVLIARMSRRG